MSLDARVVGVTYEPDGTVRLDLSPRESQTPAGQQALFVTNPQPGMEAMLGVCLWGGSGLVMIRDTPFAERLSYTRIRLVDRPAT